MATQTILDSEVLANIGTDALIAHGYSDFCIRQWRKRGVSWKERPKVQQLAIARGIKIPADFLTAQRGKDEQKKAKPATKRRSRAAA